MSDGEGYAAAGRKCREKVNRDVAASEAMHAAADLLRCSALHRLRLLCERQKTVRTPTLCRELDAAEESLKVAAVRMRQMVDLLRDEMVRSREVEK